MSPFVVWSPGSLAAAVVAGALIGALIVARFDNPRFHAMQSMGVIALLGFFLMFGFWIGQFVDTYLTDGPDLAWRVMSRFLLSLVYVAAIAGGTGVGVRRKRAGWR